MESSTALHVFDDATPNREPRTTSTDHLTGAGPLLAVLAVAALAFPGSVQASGQLAPSAW